MVGQRLTLPVRKQDKIVHQVRNKLLNTILPQAMHETDIDMWLINCQEDNPDPVI